MRLRDGDRVIAVRDIGGTLFISAFVPQGTKGVVTNVDGGFGGTDLYTVTFTVEQSIFDDSRVEINRLSDEDIAAA